MTTDEIKQAIADCRDYDDQRARDLLLAWLAERELARMEAEATAPAKR